MTMVFRQLYRCLDKAALIAPPPRGENQNPQKNWTLEDNKNWMNLRDVQHSSKISAPEAKAQVRVL